MSFLRRLFGGQTFAEARSEAEQLYVQGRIGEARLAYARALERGQDEAAEAVADVRERMARCSEKLAAARLAEADQSLAVGDLERARALYEDVLAVYDTPAWRERVAEKLREVERKLARELHDEGHEIDDDELLTVISGTWSEAQADEYAHLPDPLREALLLNHDGEHVRAAELLTGIAAREDLEVEPMYVWLEIGEAWLAADHPSEALAAIDRFLGMEPEDPEVELRALRRAASAHLALKQPAEAKARLVAATSVAPIDHTLFLELGVLHRKDGDLPASLTALEKAVELMGQMRPDMRVVRELGFTLLAQGKREEAKATLNQVVEHSASKGQHTEIDPEAAIVLAKLHDEDGQPMLAADLFRHLATGFDAPRHFDYNLKSAELLRKAGGDPATVDRYLTRARELAKSDEQRALLDAVVQAVR